MGGEHSDDGSDSFKVLVERLRNLHDAVETLGVDIKNGNGKIEEHANETRRQWENHNSEHREIDKDRIRTIGSLKDGNQKFNNLDSRIEGVRKERSKAIYLVLGIVIPMVPVTLGALWSMRGQLDDKADVRTFQETIDKKANVNDVKEIKDDIREIRAILSAFNKKGDK